MTIEEQICDTAKFCFHTKEQSKEFFASMKKFVCSRVPFPCLHYTEAQDEEISY